MSLECSECERDLRGGHDVGCSRHPNNADKTTQSAPHFHMTIYGPRGGRLAYLKDVSPQRVKWVVHEWLDRAGRIEIVRAPKHRKNRT